MSTSLRTPSPIHAFLSGHGRDGAGRDLETVLAFDDHQLEIRHDYIQWLFPLDTPSSAVPGSPVLKPADITAIRQDATATENLTRARQRMTAFYRDTDHWLVFHNHNHLRITRIITSTGLIATKQAAQAFYDAISARVAQSNNPVSPTSQTFWQDALGAIAADKS